MDGKPPKYGEWATLPADKISTKKYAERLHAVHKLIGVIPHSTRELNMITALAHPVYKEDGVVDYVDGVVILDHRESPLAIAEEMVGFYRDAITNVRDVAVLIKDMDETGRLQPQKPAMFANVQRHEDTVNFMHMPDLLNLYLDDDYTQMPNAAYSDLLMAQDDQAHIYKALKEVLADEENRAAFWLEQITGSSEEVDGQLITRKGLIDSLSPDVRSYIEQIAGIKKPAADEYEDPIFSIGKRPKIGDTTRWEKFKHRNRLNDILMIHGFLAQSNKEAEKVKTFDRLKNDPAEILKWLDMVNESNRRWEVAKDKEVNPKERLNKLIGRLEEYADDAAENSESMNGVLRAIDEKSDESALFKDSFPADEWFRDYPEYRLPFVKMAEFLQTEAFIKNGQVDNITKKARSRNEPTVQDELDLILDKLGNLPLTKIAEIAERYQMDQINRFNYWQKILEMTRAHRMAAPAAHQALFRLATKAPRYDIPNDPRSVIEPTYTEEQPF